MQLHHRSSIVVLSLGLLLAGVGCGTAVAPGQDGGTKDAGGQKPDAGTTDAGGTDAGVSDAGTTDAGGSDAGVTDAGTTDGGGSDAGVACTSAAQCNDGDACTTDTCDVTTGTCSHTAMSCNDSDACTTDACDPATGCTHTPISCNDGSACTTDTCDPTTGCVNTPISCNDGNACTTDTCDPTTGCVNTPISCDDGITCTVDSCDAMTGACLHTPDNTVCSDGNACTTNTCDPATGDPVTGCTSTPVVCNDGNVCTTDTCDPTLGCVYTNNTATCTAGACTGTCSAGACSCTCTTNADCNDNNACTVDTCGATGCSNTLRTVDPASSVSETSSCLTLGAGARSVVIVDLRDTSGVPLTGATVTFNVTGDPVIWLDPAVTESTTTPGVYYRTMLSPPSGASSTITATVAVCTQTVTLAQSVTVTYAPAVAYATGGTGGCSPQDGNVRVRVVEKETGNPVAGAFVMIGPAESTTAYTTSVETFLSGGAGARANTATTDARGYAWFSDLGTGLDGAKMITAGATGRAYMTLVDVGTSDVVLPLPITSPATTRVTLQGTGQPPYATNNDANVEVAVVTPTLDLGFFTNFSIGNLLESNRPASIGGATCIAPMTMNVPGNVEVPSQTVIGCQVTATPPDWTVQPLSGAPVDLAGLQAHAAALTLAGGGGPAQLIAALTFDQVGLDLGQSTSTSQTGLAVNFTQPLAATMPVTASNAPAGDIYLVSLGDLDGQNGTGRLFLQGLSVANNATTATAPGSGLTTAPSAGAFAGTTDIAMAIDLANAGGLSAVLDRTTTGRTAQRTFDSFFDPPGATVTGRTFAWNAVATTTSPATYSLSRSVLRRLTPAGDYRKDQEPFWIVYAPPTDLGFTLPTLPAAAPRSASGGYLVPDTTLSQTNAWYVGLTYEGLAASPVDLANYDFSTTIPDLTQLSADDVALP